MTQAHSRHVPTLTGGGSLKEMSIDGSAKSNPRSMKAKCGLSSAMVARFDSYHCLRG